MIDIYSIGVTLKINDLIGPQLVLLAKQFEKIDLLASQVNRSLKAMGVEASGIKAVANATGNLDKKLERANRQSILLEQNLRNIRGLGALPGGGPSAYPTVIPGNGGYGHRGGGRGGLHGGNIHAGPGGVGIGTVGMGLGADAMLPLAIAGAGAYATHSLYEAGKKLEKVKADFGNMNLSKADNESVLRQAWALTNGVRGSKVADNVALIHDLHTATGDLAHALEMSGDYTKFSVAAKIQNEGRDVHGLVMDSIKALEHRGDKVLQDPAMREKELRMQSQVDFFTRGTVGPDAYFGMSRTGKLAYQLASPEYLYGPAAALISANTGTTAGTMEMTALSSLIGGHMEKKGKGFLTGLGLWNEVLDPKVAAMRASFDKDPEYQKIVAANGGSLIQSGGLSFDNAKLFAENRNDFILTVLYPAIRKKYGLNVTDEDAARLLTGNFNRNTSADLAFYITNQAKVSKDTKGIRGTNNFFEAYLAYMKTAAGAETEFSGAWNSFKTEFSKAVLPAITDMLKGGAVVLRGITDFAKNNSEILSFFGNRVHVTPGGYVMDALESGFNAGKKLLNPSTGVTGSWGDPVRTAGGAPVQVHTQINLDGREVARNTTQHQSRAASVPQSGRGGIDPGMMPLSPGMNLR